MSRKDDQKNNKKPAEDEHIDNLENASDETSKKENIDDKSFIEENDSIEYDNQKPDIDKDNNDNSQFDENQLDLSEQENKALDDKDYDSVSDSDSNEKHESESASLQSEYQEDTPNQSFENNHTDMSDMQEGHPKSSGKGLAGTALLASLLALGGSAYLYLQKDSNNSEITQKIDQLESNISTAQDNTSMIQEGISSIEQNISSNQDSLNSLTEQQTEIRDIATQSQQFTDEIQKQVDDLSEQFATQKDQVKEQLDNWKSNVENTANEAKERIDNEVSEIRSLLDQSKQSIEKNSVAIEFSNIEKFVIAAEQQLNVFNNPQAAISALTIAKSAVLDLASEADLMELNQAIDNDLSTLNSFVASDESDDVAVQLIKLVNNVEALPLLSAANATDMADDDSATNEKNDVDANNQTSEVTESSSASESEGEASPWYLSIKNKVFDTAENIGSEILSDLGNVVTVESTEPKADAAFIPEEEYFIRQNLNLLLQSAQLAWLQRSDNIYQANMTQAQQWVSEYFASESPEVQQFTNQLVELKEQQTSQSMPDISASVEALSTIPSADSMTESEADILPSENNDQNHDPRIFPEGEALNIEDLRQSENN